MKFSEYIAEELNNDPQKAIPEIKTFFEKYFKKFKIAVKTIRVEILQNTRFGVEVVGSAKDSEEIKKLRSKLPFGEFKGIDGRNFEFTRLENVKRRYSIEYDERGGTFETFFYIEPTEIRNFYK